MPPVSSLSCGLLRLLLGTGQEAASSRVKSVAKQEGPKGVSKKRYMIGHTVAVNFQGIAWLSALEVIMH